mgnify:CR=1 FL=1
MRLRFRLIGGNSGIQIRSREVPDWDTSGYQADMDAEDQYTGGVYEHTRGVIAPRGWTGARVEAWLDWADSVAPQAAGRDRDGTALLAGGLMVLMLDLGRPDRVIVAATHYNFRSVFAWNVFLYSGMAAIMTGIVASAFANQLSRKKSAYQAQLRQVLADGVVSEAEKDALKRLQMQFRLSDKEVQTMMEQAQAGKNP